MEKIIFVVEGSTGEYSDHCEWLVCAFENEDKAKDFVNKCTEEYLRVMQDLETLENSHGYSDYVTDVESGKLKAHQYDPKFDTDYTGTNYTYYKTKLITD